MEQRIIGTVVGVEPQDANTFFVEVECEALEDATAFQIVSTDLPFKHVALNRAAGSRLKLICAQGAEISVGAEGKICRQTVRKFRSAAPSVKKCFGVRRTRRRSDLKTRGYVRRADCYGDSHPERTCHSTGYWGSRGWPELKPTRVKLRATPKLRVERITNGSVTSKDLDERLRLL